MPIELPADVLVIISQPYPGDPFAPWINPQFSVTDWQKPSVGELSNYRTKSSAESCSSCPSVDLLPPRLQSDPTAPDGDRQ
jgi:hypothetical protein